MWRYLFWLVVLLFMSLPGKALAQVCTPPSAPASAQELTAWLDCTLGELQAVWAENITTAILEAYPDFEQVMRLDLAYVSDCDFSPRLEETGRDGQSEIIFNTRLLIPQMMVSQAIHWYLIAPKGMATSSSHLDYLNNVLLPAVREDSRLCSRRNAVGRFSAVNVPSIFYLSPKEYPAYVQLDSPQTRSVGDYVGALPTFFALIHEAGHAALHSDDRSLSIAKMEEEADAFAATVFDVNKVPSTLGLGYLLLAYDLDRRGSSEEIACRIIALAESAASQDQVQWAELGVQAVNRIEDLRKGYISYYRPLCKTR